MKANKNPKPTIESSPRQVTDKNLNKDLPHDTKSHFHDCSNHSGSFCDLSLKYQINNKIKKRFRSTFALAKLKNNLRDKVKFREIDIKLLESVAIEEEVLTKMK